MLSEKGTSHVCEILVKLLGNLPSYSEEFMDIFLSLMNNLAFEPEASRAFLNHRCLQALAVALKQEKNANIRSYIIEIIASKLLPYIKESNPINKKVALHTVTINILGLVGNIAFA